MASGFSVTVTAVDNATKAIDKINKKFASISAPVTRLNASMKKFTEVSGIKKMSDGISRLGSGLGGLARSASSVVAPLGILTSAASVAGIIELTERFGEFGSQLKFNAQNIGIQVNSLASLQGAALLAGSSGASLTSGMLNLSQAITDAGGGRNMEALGYFRQLGINIRGANGALRTADQVLPDVADGIAKISNPALQRRVAAAFGLSDDLLPFLRRGSQGLREYQEEARRYGAVNEAGAAASNMLREAQARLTLSAEGLGNAVAVQLAPVLTPLLTDLANWIASHRTDIAMAVGDIAKEFSAWAKSGGIERLTATLGDMATSVDSVVKMFGGWKTSAEILGVVLIARVLSPLLSILSVMSRLALAAPVWLTLPLLLKGDEADNPEANDARTARTAEQTRDYLARQRRGSSPANDPQSLDYQPNNAVSVGTAIRNWWNGSASKGASATVDKLVTMGWSKEQAAGLAANFQRESNFDPGQIGDGGQAYGIGQWHPDRQADFKAWSGHDIHGTGIDEQLAFAHYELTKGKEQAAGNLLKQARSAGEAGDIVSQHYERPGDRYGEAQARAMLAQRIYSAPPSTQSPLGIETYAPPLIKAIPGPYSAPTASAAPAPAPAASADGVVKVEIVHRNAPPGTSMTHTSTGAVSTSARVEGSSLMAPT